MKYLKIIVIITVLSLPLIFSLAPQEILKLKTFDTFVKTPEPVSYTHLRAHETG